MKDVTVRVPVPVYVKVPVRVYVKVPVRVYVKVPVTPDIPAGAHLPSTRPALSLTRFFAAGANIGCNLTGVVARCDIAKRIWTPPVKPSTCRLDWGQGIEVGASGASTFVCARDTVLAAKYIVPDGRDVTVGTLTCQVRQFGVTCFGVKGRHGFSLSRTGYTTF